MFINAQALFGALLAMGMLSILVCLLLIGHGVWVVKLFREDGRQGLSPWAQSARFLIFLATPVLGFLVAKFMQWPPASADEKSTPNRSLLPVAALVFIVIMTMVVQSQFGTYRQQSLMNGGWEGLAEMFAKIFGLYALVHANLYMFAQVTGGSQHSIWTTFTHVVTMVTCTAFLVLLLA